MRVILRSFVVLRRHIVLWALHVGVHDLLVDIRVGQKSRFIQEFDIDTLPPRALNYFHQAVQPSKHND